MDSREFLQQVITTPQGYIELAIRTTSDKQWTSMFYDWPSQVDEVLLTAKECQDDCDVYFSSHLFKSKDSHKDNVLPTRTIQQDLDNADIASLPLIGSIITETSPLRHQGFWLLNETLDSYSHELLSKRLAYSIPLCDHSGWPLGHKFRLPGTINHKYSQPYEVVISQVNPKRYAIEDLELLPELDAPLLISGDHAFINSPPSTYPIGPYELLESVKDQITTKVYAEYLSGDVSGDRSLALYTLEIQLFKAGLSREQVYWIALHSPNNKFRIDLRFNNERELAKHVLSAERAYKSLSLNIRDTINEIRKKTKMLKAERNRLTYEVVVDAMKQEGDFVSLVDGRKFYTLREQGRPMGIGHYNTPLASLMDTRYGLNKTEIEHSYVVDSLIAYTEQLPDTATGATLSYYDYLSKNLLIHSGRKTVYQITSDEITTVTNGSYGVMFQWDRIIEPFTPAPYDADFDWSYALFGSIPNVLNVSEEEARVILKVWTLFTLVRNAANTRPILALLGQPGSAKTTLAHKLYAFFYGRHTDVSGITNPASFDMATANLPLLVLDNLDTWEKWIPDRLAQAASKTDVIVRKLYSDNQVVRLKRQAMLAVTAHDPKFGRADVADRMIILSLLRFENLGIKFVDEAGLINEVLRNRNRIWGAVMHDLRHILSTPLTDSDLQLRIQDFAKLGEWIAAGTTSPNDREIFRNAVLRLKNTQTVFNLDEESILVTALQKWLAKCDCHPQPKTQEQLYQEILLIIPKEDFAQFVYLYKSSGHLGRRLSTLQSTLHSLMKVEFTIRKDGQRLWLITCNEDTDATES